MSLVIVQKASYEDPFLEEKIFSLLEGGPAIPKGGLVLIKPNLLSPARPGQAILTHPLVVRAAVRYVLEKGARPLVADSPAMGSFERLLRLSGVGEALRGLAVECRPFSETVMVDIGPPYGEVAVAREALEADFVLNLPKLKTHTQMLLTLAVKNLFGCIVGYEKPRWHLRAGISRETFARLLVQLCRALKPSYTILDGILALEGDGPGTGGTPKELGILLAGSDPFAVDVAVCRILGLAPAELPTLKAASQDGPLPEPCLDGFVPEIRGFRLPSLVPLLYGPRRLHGFIRRQLIQRPVYDGSRCRLCGECAKICPAGSISVGRDRIGISYDNCIRCYCCVEVCPFGAIRPVEPAAGRIVRRLASFIMPAARKQ